MQPNRILHYNHLNLAHDDYIAVERTLFNGWFAFKNKAYQCGLFSIPETSRIDGINQRLANHLRSLTFKHLTEKERDAEKATTTHTALPPAYMDREVALMIWDVYHLAKEWPLLMNSFGDSDIIPNMESIIEIIKTFCLNKSIDEAIKDAP
jgi:hypothetical protein